MLDQPDKYLSFFSSAVSDKEKKVWHLGEEVDEGEDHQIEDGQGELVPIEQQRVERVASVCRYFAS